MTPEVRERMNLIAAGRIRRLMPKLVQPDGTLPPQLIDQLIAVRAWERLGYRSLCGMIMHELPSLTVDALKPVAERALKKGLKNDDIIDAPPTK